MLEIIETNRELCIVLELADGGELLDYIVAQEKISENKARSFFKQMVFALEYMHEMKIAHRVCHQLTYNLY